MKKKKNNVWIITNSGGSPYHGPNMRVYYLARNFVKQGLNVSIISASFSHKYFNLPKVRDKINYENIDGIIYCWIRTISYKKNKIKRIINYLQFAYKVGLYGHRLKLPEPDVIIASSPPPFITFPCYKIAKKFKAQFIFEVRDLWPLTIMELENLKWWHPMIIFMSYFEKLGYKKAKKVVSVLPKAKFYMESRGMDSSKFCYIPNGLDITTIERYKENLDYNIKNKIRQLKNKLIVGYTGFHGKNNCLKPLIKAAKIIQKKNKNIHFVLVGKGPKKEKLIKLSKEKKLNNITFLNTITKNQIQNILDFFNICYIGWKKRKSLNKYGTSPQKIFDYMYAGKPILNSTIEKDDLIKQANCGISTEAENPKAIAYGILKLTNIPEEQRKKMGQNGKKYLIANHDYAKLAQKYINLFNEI